jgi:hypothetical protein
MKVLKATRLAGNPRRVAPRKKANARTKRKMNPKQIRIFGTKRQKAALKMKRRSKPAHRPRTKSNPLVVTLKPVRSASNPNRKRSNNVAAKRRRRVSNRRRVVAVNRRRPNRRRRTVRASNPHRRRRPVMVARRRRSVNAHHRRRRRSNPSTRIVVMAPRKSNRRRSGTRNPNLFGSALGSKSTLKIIGGGLVGVAAAKFIPQILPTSLTSTLTGNPFGQMLITGACAVGAGWIAGKLDTQFGDGVLFGGLMQTASVGLNAFLPNFTIGGVPIALGDLVQGQFAVPQNPLRQRGGQAALPAGTASSAMPAASGVKVTQSGLGRAYPAAY